VKHHKGSRQRRHPGVAPVMSVQPPELFTVSADVFFFFDPPFGALRTEHPQRCARRASRGIGTRKESSSRSSG